MKKIFKYSYYILILFLLFIFKSPINYAFKNINSIFKKNTLSDANLEILKAENKYLKKEIKNLKKFNLDDYNNYDYLNCKILERNVYDFYNYLIIDKGKDKNIKKNAAVISENGIVGIVDKVYKKTAKVKLISSNNLNMSIKVNNSYGVVKKFIKDTNEFEVSMTDNNNIKVGDKIYTSGLGITQSDIYVGYVTKLIKENIEYKLYFKTSYNIKNLNNLVVLKELRNV